MKRDLTTRMLAASALLALLVGGVVAVLAVTLHGFKGTSQRVRHSEEVIASADRLEQLVLDLETGERGFMLTRQQPFLAPWRAAGQELPAATAQLERMAADNPDQSRRARGISRAAITYYRSWSLPIVQLARRDPSAATAKTSTGAGKRQVDAIRRRVDRFVDVERRRLNQRRDDATTAGQRAAFLGLGGIVASVLLILAFSGYLARKIVVPLRRVAAAADRVAAGDLAARVPPVGPGELGALAEAFNSMAGSLEASHEQLETRNAELARRAAINRAVLEATKEAIAMFDVSGRLQLTNPAMDRFLQLVGVAGRPGLLELASEVRIATSDPQSYWKAMAHAAESPALKVVDEFEVVDAAKAFASYTSPVRDGDGRIIGRVLAIRDVTEEREADRIKSELVSTVSHELRTPLASILGFAELMATEEREPEASVRFAQTIHRQARRLADLIDDFLDLQQVEAKRMPVTPEPFDLTELLAEQVEAFSGQSADHRLALHADRDPTIALADRERTAQVVGNLLSNAIKYSPDGGPVDVGLTRDDGVVRVEVTDRGIGIRPEDRDGIFTKFFRVDSSNTRAIGGTGLGLALSRELVEAQDGRIGFDSTPGSGSTFWFELPAAEAGELRRAV